MSPATRASRARSAMKVVMCGQPGHKTGGRGMGLTAGGAGVASFYLRRSLHRHARPRKAVPHRVRAQLAGPRKILLPLDGDSEGADSPLDHGLELFHDEEPPHRSGKDAEE